MGGMATGLFWYKEDQYETLKNMAEDSANLPDSYADWLIEAKKAEKNLMVEGCEVIKVVVDIDEFKEFCATSGCKINSKSRSSFAAYKVNGAF